MDSDPPPPYEESLASSDDDNAFEDIESSDDGNDPGINWARNHLVEARTALASYDETRRVLKRQVLEEQEVIRLGIDHHGPPPAHTARVIVPPWKNSRTLRDVVPTSSVFGPGNIEAELDDAIRYGAFGFNNLMPALPRRADPLRDAFKGVQTMPVRNPSVQWGAMVPRQHFPGVEVEGIIPEMESTPEFVVVKRHVCGTECPDECHQGGGERKKGKGKPLTEIEDVEGGEAMQGVVYAHWGDDDFNESEDSGSDHERMEKLREQKELETIETLQHCAVIEEHRRKWAAEIGALTYKARIMTEKLPSISINTIERRKEKIEIDEPAFLLVGKMAKRIDERRNDKKNRDDRRKQERTRLAKMRIATWRARMRGRDIAELREEARVDVFNSLVASGNLGPAENDPDDECSGSCELPPVTESDGAPGPAPRSPDKEGSAIDDSPGPSVATKNTPTSDDDKTRPPQDSHPTVKSTEEAVAGLTEEDNKSQEAASQEDVPDEIGSLEATAQDTAEEESIAQALIAQAAIVRDATSTDPDLEETPIHDSVPQETTSGEAAPKDTTIEASSSKEATPEDTTSEKSGTSAPKEATPEESTTEKADTEETPAQEFLGPGPGPSRKRPAPKKSSLKKRPAKRQSIRESPFLEPLEREPPPEWILQRDGRLIRNPLADIHSGPLAGRRWSNPDIDAPVPMPPPDLESRPRSATVSEGAQPPAPRCSAEDTLPRIGDEGQTIQHVEVVGESSAPLSPAERAAADRERMPPPARPPPSPLSPRRRKRSLAISEGSQSLNLWSSDDMFPSIERLSQAVEQTSSGGDSAADVTSLAPARAGTPEPPDMQQEEARRTACELEAMLGAAEERFGDPDTGFLIVMTNPRMAELAISHRPRRPSILRMECVVDEEVLEAEAEQRSALEQALEEEREQRRTLKKALDAEEERRRVLAEELERGPFASRVPDPPRYNLRSRSRTSTENPSPATPSVFSPETSGSSSEATSVSVTPAVSGDSTSEAAAAVDAADDRRGEGIAEGKHLLPSPALPVDRQLEDRDATSGVEGSGEGEANPWREGSAGTDGSTGGEGRKGREESAESEGSIGGERSVGREGSITTEVAETLGGLAVESVGEGVGEGGGADEGAGALGTVLPSTEVPEEAIEDEGEGAPLTKVTSHSSTKSL
ncbi:hypothetical protein VE03_02241 [Pseudogymnoascus sp. 23342-1-I1]|nr:hypothetical protein VE03_02241 [Pseudogymnoascus sp. 23342-1-I1]